MGRGDLTSLFFLKVAKQVEVRGELCSNVENKKSFTSRLVKHSIFYHLIIAMLYNFTSQKRTERCFGTIFITIDTQHHSKTIILTIRARTMRILTRALTFKLVYCMLHKIFFRMNGRSTLYVLQFSQILLLKFHLYIFYKNFIWSISSDLDTVAL